MPPLGKWLRPVIAGSVTAAIAIGAWVATAYAEGDLRRLAAKYPVVAATQSAKDAVSRFPVIGGLVAFFSGPLLDKAAEGTMSPEDAKALESDHAIVTWAPIVGIAALAIGGIVTLYLTWVDVLRGPTATQALGTAGLATAVPLAVVPTPGAQAVAPVLAQASAPATVAVPMEVHA